MPAFLTATKWRGVTGALIVGAIIVVSTFLRTPYSAKAEPKVASEIQDYRVVIGTYEGFSGLTTNGKQEFMDFVKKCISEGWEPQGGVSVAVDPSREATPLPFFIVTQAMVKRR